MNKSIKRTLVIGLTGAAVVVAGAWYVTAGNRISSTEAYINAINTKQRTDGSKVMITYDKLARTSFPSIGVRLVNPGVEVNAPGLPDPNGDTTATPQPIHILWKHTGTVDITTDYLKHQYRVVTDGSGAGSLETGGDTVSITSSAAHTEVSLRAKDGEGFSRWESIDFADQTAMKKAFSDVGEFHLAAGPFSVKDATSGAVMAAHEHGSLDFVNRSKDKQIDFDLSVVSKGSEVTKEYGDIMTRALTMLHLPTDFIDGSMPMAATRAGKQDLEIEMSVNMPETVPNQPTPKGNIHVKKFNIKNNFYTVQAPFDMVLDEDAVKRSANIKLNWVLDITPQGAEELQITLDRIAQLPMFAAATQSMDQATLKQKITDALPTMSTLGPVNLILDVEAVIPKADDTTAVKETLNLRQFSFTHKRWGIEAKIEASRDKAVRGSTVNGNILCKQCTTLTQDTFETAKAAQEVMQLLQPGQPAMPLEEERLTLLNTTLAEIGKPGTTSGDLDFVLSTPTPGEVLVNERPIAEVLPKLLMVFMAPPTPAEQAPAPTPAPAPAPADTSSPAI